MRHKEYSLCCTGLNIIIIILFAAGKSHIKYIHRGPEQDKSAPLFRHSGAAVSALTVSAPGLIGAGTNRRRRFSAGRFGAARKVITIHLSLIHI